MKKAFKSFLIFTGVMLLCCAVMIGSSYLYLEISLKSSDADTAKSNIPYSAPLPDSSGLLLRLPDNSGYMIFLDFSSDSLTMAKIDEVKPEKQEYYGYPVSFTIDADYRALAGIIDRIGGIELHDNGKMLRYTGSQVIDKIHSTTQNSGLIKEVIEGFFQQLCTNGFSKEDFVYIIENTSTDITVPDIYYWPPYIADICENLQFVNL